MATDAETVRIPIRRQQVELTRFADIEESRLEWLWPGRIPLGKLTVIAGDPGLGKSLVTIAIAAAVTSETKWPDCHEYAPHGSVILLSAEDDDRDTVRPRLRAAGADLEHVYSMSGLVENKDGSRRGLALDTDLHLIRENIDRVPNCRLVVIDPISAFLGSVDSHKNADVRGVLSVLSDIAQERRVAILYVSHLNKGTGGPMARISGSGAFVAAARSGMIVGRDPADPERRLIFMPKCNLSKEVDGVAYRVHESADDADLPVIQWEPGFVSIDGDELLSADSSHEKSALEDAKNWLIAELSDGPVLSADLKRLAGQVGHSWRTVERAKFELKVISRKDGMTKKWKSALPGHE